MTTYYKILRTNRASWHDKNFVWSLHKPVEVKDAEPNGPCGRGLHLAKSMDGGFRYARFPARVFEAEALSPILGEDDTKVRVARAQLGDEVTSKWVEKVNEFIKSLRYIPWMKHEKPPLDAWKMFDTRDAAGDAAGATARAAAGDAARAAAGDAARQSIVFLCDDLALDPKHRKHAKDRMEVWKRGYGLLCDVDGVLYVYREV